MSAYDQILGEIPGIAFLRPLAATKVGNPEDIVFGKKLFPKSIQFWGATCVFLGGYLLATHTYSHANNYVSHVRYIFPWS